MRLAGYILGLLALLVAIAIVAKQRQHVLESGLPLRIQCLSEDDAKERAGPGAVPVLGTGSMAPFIPAAPKGKDPYKTNAAYVVFQSGATFEDITPGRLVVYKAEWAKGAHVIHGAATKDSYGWIPSGLHNDRSESWARITPANLVGIIARVYVWPL
jgi:hypothetical protein